MLLSCNGQGVQVGEKGEGKISCLNNFFYPFHFMFVFYKDLTETRPPFKIRRITRINIYTS